MVVLPVGALKQHNHFTAFGLAEGHGLCPCEFAWQSQMGVTPTWCVASLRLAEDLFSPNNSVPLHLD